ncbi:MFS general substrate transporter [Multifurca ochricompacta]|uniref:MFS general substrate transporter n=1 Tax=Multifurca ochricompacta TaxID=376703 RepID=A0AAD4QLN8_9AGAM|nr:MFS general substrate transporter [Multifurca ochricompacta]
MFGRNRGSFSSFQRLCLAMAFINDSLHLDQRLFPPNLCLVPQKKGDAKAEICIMDSESSEENYPDGGLQAWTVIFGSACVNFSTVGYMTAWGAFQEYYENGPLKGTSPSAIAWIGSTQYSLVFFPALLVGRLFDLGHFRYPLMAASVLLVLCTVLIAECTEYWHFLLCQGLGLGITSGIIAGPAASVVAHWFKKRRGTALGLYALGSPLGGTVFPILFRNLHVAVGFKWTLRIIALILTFTLVMANLTLKRRLRPKSDPGGLLNPEQFKSPAYSLYTAAGLVCFLGLYTVSTFINASARSQGIEGELTFYLVSIANAGSVVGRVSVGVVADRFGALTVMIPTTFLAGVLTILWPFVRGPSPLVVVALLYGASSGAFAGLLLAPMMEFGDTSDVGRRTGMFATILAFGALAGPPISGAINRSTGGYTAVGIYAGSAVIVAVVLLVLSRYCILGGWRGKA